MKYSVYMNSGSGSLAQFCSVLYFIDLTPICYCYQFRFSLYFLFIGLVSSPVLLVYLCFIIVLSFFLNFFEILNQTLYSIHGGKLLFLSFICLRKMTCISSFQFNPHLQSFFLSSTEPMYMNSALPDPMAESSGSQIQAMLPVNIFSLNGLYTVFILFYYFIVIAIL